MKNKEAFSKYNPMVILMFFTGAVLFNVMFIHPVFLVISLVISVLYCLFVKGRSAFSLIVGMIPVFVIVSAVNPLFNTGGDKVLFMLTEMRPYTLQALLYGMAVAAVFISVIIWFASYNVVMDSDGILYVFGKRLPAFSMIFVMVMRLVPDLLKKMKDISDGRKCIGVDDEDKGISGKIKNGMTVISVMFSWTLENSVITGDSMKSRGYGVSERTFFSLFKVRKKDMIISAVMVVLAGIVVFCAVRGGMSASYIPKIVFADGSDIYFSVGIIAYILFLMIPVGLNIAEVLKWRVLKSKI